MQPVYTRCFVAVKDDAENGIICEVNDAPGVTVTIREATQEEIIASLAGRRSLYVKIDHKLEYPFTAVDLVQIVSEEENKLYNAIFDQDMKPWQFCRASMAFVPKMSLI